MRKKEVMSIVEEAVQNNISEKDINKLIESKINDKSLDFQFQKDDRYFLHQEIKVLKTQLKK